MPFGDYEVSQAPAVDPGVYDAIVESAEVVYDNGVPKVNDNGKNLCDVMFTIDAQTKLRRRYTIAFGQNKQTSQWAAFAKFLESTTGIRCGDPNQKALDDSDVRGRRVRIVVETNDRGYADVTNVLPSARERAAAAAGARPARAQPEPPPPAEDEGYWPDADGEIPF